MGWQEKNTDSFHLKFLKLILTLRPVVRQGHSPTSLHCLFLHTFSTTCLDDIGPYKCENRSNQKRTLPTLITQTSPPALQPTLIVSRLTKSSLYPTFPLVITLFSLFFFVAKFLGIFIYIHCDFSLAVFLKSCHSTPQPLDRYFFCQDH